MTETAKQADPGATRRLRLRKVRNRDPRLRRGAKAETRGQGDGYENRPGDYGLIARK